MFGADADFCHRGIETQRRRRLSGGKFGPAEFGGAGAGVGADFFFVGDDAIGGDFRIDTGTEAVAEGMFDAAVFAGVEGDDGDSAAGGEAVGGDGEEAVEVREFAIDHDAERLEGAGGGVQLRAGGTFQREATGLADDGGEFLRGLDGFGLAAVDDQFGDLRGVGFVAEFEEGGSEFVFGEAIDEGRGGLAARGVHAHIEGAGGAVGEAAGGVVDLGGGDAEVGEDGVGFFNAGLCEDGGQGGEVGLEELEVLFGAGDGREAFVCDGEAGGVKVDAEEFAFGEDAFEEFGGMAPKTQGAIDDDVAGARG